MAAMAAAQLPPALLSAMRLQAGGGGGGGGRTDKPSLAEGFRDIGQLVAVREQRLALILDAAGSLGLEEQRRKDGGTQAASGAPAARRAPQPAATAAPGGAPAPGGSLTAPLPSDAQVEAFRRLPRLMQQLAFAQAQFKAFRLNPNGRSHPARLLWETAFQSENTYWVEASEQDTAEVLHLESTDLQWAASQAWDAFCLAVQASDGPSDSGIALCTALALAVHRVLHIPGFEAALLSVGGLLLGLPEGCRGDGSPGAEDTELLDIVFRAAQALQVSPQDFERDQAPPAAEALLPVPPRELPQAAGSSVPAAAAATPAAEGSLKSATLEELAGEWRLVGVDQCWVLDTEGQVFFAGACLGEKYRLLRLIRRDIGGCVVVIERGDGWAVDLERSSPNRLVWVREGQEDRVWERSSAAPAPAAAPPPQESGEAGGPEPLPQEGERQRLLRRMTTLQTEAEQLLAETEDLAWSSGSDEEQG